MDTSLSRELVEVGLSIARLLRREFRVEAGASAISMNQFRMLHKMKNGACQVGKLAEALGVSQPAASVMVNGMVEDGYIKRLPHPTDRRQIELHLTKKALHRLETSYKRAFAKIDDQLTDLSAAKKAALAKQLAEICKLLVASDDDEIGS